MFQTNHPAFISADRSFSRLINQNSILRMIYESDGISRAQLAKLLGISKPAVTSNVENLISKGIVIEKGEGSAAKNGGRKPVMLYANSTFRYVGAVDVSFIEPVCAIANLNHEIVSLKRIRLTKGATAQMRKDAVANAFAEMLHETKISKDLLEVITISSPGLIAQDGGRYFTNKQHHIWTEIGLEVHLSQAFGASIVLQNDVNLAAVGEHAFGQPEKIDNLIYVSCGMGLGAGIILNGELYVGKHGAAGEIGSVLMADGIKLEDYIALEGLIKRIQASSGLKAQALYTVEAIAACASENQAIAEIVRDTGAVLGRYLYNCCMILDIDTVVFGGDYLKLGEMLLSPMREQMVLQNIFQPRIIEAQMDPIAGIYGCLVVGVEQLLTHLNV